MGAPKAEDGRPNQDTRARLEERQERTEHARGVGSLVGFVSSRAAGAPAVMRARERGPDLVIMVRPEVSSDHEAVRQVHDLAFLGPVEATLVERLRGSPGSISLVAAESGGVVGHILFTTARIVGAGARVRIAGLGPMAVTPTRQRCGIGSELVLHGLEACRRVGYEAVVVVGHPAYYPRFGFQRGSSFGLRCQFDVPDDVFLATELQAGVLSGGGGEVRYASEFSEG